MDIINNGAKTNTLLYIDAKQLVIIIPTIHFQVWCVCVGRGGGVFELFSRFRRFVHAEHIRAFSIGREKSVYADNFCGNFLNNSNLFFLVFFFGNFLNSQLSLNLYIFQVNLCFPLKFGDINWLYSHSPHGNHPINW